MQHDHDNALRELQSLLSKGISLHELQTSVQSTNNTMVAINKELGSQPPHLFGRRHDVGQWLYKYSKEHTRNNYSPSSALMDAVEKYMGGDSVIHRQSYRFGNYEIMVNCHISLSYLNLF